MDETKPSMPPHDVGARIGSDAEPILADVRRRGGISTVVFCGDAEQVERGFNIALRIMGVEVDQLEEGIALPVSPIKGDDHGA
jgi:hypothetical protein